MLGQSSIHASKRPPVDAYDSSNDNGPDDEGSMRAAAFVTWVCIGIAGAIVVAALIVRAWP
jgi:hypothetical protein